jgi:hypothetical protein
MQLGIVRPIWIYIDMDIYKVSLMSLSERNGALARELGGIGRAVR